MRATAIAIRRIADLQLIYRRTEHSSYTSDCRGNSQARRGETQSNNRAVTRSLPGFRPREKRRASASRVSFMMMNILRHAQATSVDVTMVEEASEFVLTIKDTGRVITEDEKSSISLPS